MQAWGTDNRAVGAAHEMSICFSDARDDPKIGAIILTGADPASIPATPLMVFRMHLRSGLSY